jgi:NAD(P)-dependent dehydrogenase (short-subunit alcohol dehydrogenase family)
MKILIAGSSSGIGLSLTRHLRAANHKVWAVARRKSPGTHSRCDLSYYKKCRAVACAVEKKWGHVDAIIVCAGMQPLLGKTLQANDTDWHSGVFQNLGVTFNSIRAFSPLFNGSELRPKIVVFSGGGASKGRPYFSSYACAKTAIVRLCETIAEEEHTLDINAVAPGLINTQMTMARLKAPLGLAGEAEIRQACEAMKTGGDSIQQVCELVDFLISGESNGISGRLISAQHDSWESIRTARTDTERFKLRRTT